MKRYPIGNLIRLSGAFFDLNGALVDPSVIHLNVTDPTGSSATYTFGSSAMVKDSTGNYHFDLDVETIGQWSYRWYSTGTVQAARSRLFLAIP